MSTYFTVSVLFWFTGLIPDLPRCVTARRGAGRRLRAMAYGFFALGWRGGNRQWRHYEMAYLLLAALSTPLVLSVHTIVSFDFATSVVPGWHTTIFPPYFVAGAIFGGFAMVLTLMLPMRLIFPQLKDMITPRHIDVMCKIILLTGTIVGYAYIMEFFVSWYSAQSLRAVGLPAWPRGRAVLRDIPFPAPGGGRGRGAEIAMGTVLVGLPVHDELQRALAAILLVPLVPPQPVGGHGHLHVRERGHVVRALRHHRDEHPRRLPALFVGDVPSDLGGHDDLCTGTFGLFLALFLLFIRFLPAIAIAEVKGVTPMADPHSGHGTAFGYAAGAQPEPTHLLTPEQGGPSDPAASTMAMPASGVRARLSERKPE